MDMEMVNKEEKNFSEQPVVFKAKDQTVHQCACGRTVCCGKHHKGCSCLKGKERE